MSSNCKNAKGISLFMLLLGIVAIASGIFMIVAAPGTANVTTVEDPVITTEVFGIIMVATGVLYFAAGITGALGANHPAKLGTFIVFATIVSFVNLFELALAISFDSSIWQNLLLAAVGFAGALFAARAKKEATAI